MLVFEELQEACYPTAQEVHRVWLLHLFPACGTLPLVIKECASSLCVCGLLLRPWTWVFHWLSVSMWGSRVRDSLAVVEFCPGLSACSGFSHLALECGCLLADALCCGVYQGQPCAKEARKSRSRGLLIAPERRCGSEEQNEEGAVSSWLFPGWIIFLTWLFNRTCT